MPLTLTDLILACCITLVIGIALGMVLMHLTEKSVMRP